MSEFKMYFDNGFTVQSHPQSSKGSLATLHEVMTDVQVILFSRKPLDK